MEKLLLLIIVVTLPCYSGDNSLQKNNNASDVKPPEKIQQDFAPDNLKGKTLVLNFKRAFGYSMVGMEGGWYRFKNSKNCFQKKIKFETEPVLLPNHANQQPAEFFLRKTGPNTLILTWDSNPKLDPEKIVEIDEYITSYLFHFTGKDSGTASIITASYGGEHIILDIPFTIKDNAN